MAIETVQVRMIASRRGADYVHLCGQTVAIAADLAAQFIREGAAVRIKDSTASAARTEAAEGDPDVFSGDAAGGAKGAGRVARIADRKPNKAT